MSVNRNGDLASQLEGMTASPVEICPLVLKHESLGDRIKRRLMDPGWLTSLVAHLFLLVILACLVLPSVRRQTIVVEAVSISDPGATFVEFETPDLQFDNLPAEAADRLEKLKPSEGFDEFSPLDDLSLDSDDTEDVLVKTNLENMDALVKLPTKLTAKAPVIDHGESEKQRIKEKKVKDIQSRVFDAGGRSGEVQFSLSWNSRSDLDLHVIAPSGERICYENRLSPCGGALDVDRNARGNKTTTTPVENIRWLKQRAPTGRYTVIVHLFRPRDNEGSIDFTMMAKTGDKIDIDEKSVSWPARLRISRYVYFAPSLTTAEREVKMEQLKELQAKEEKIASEQLAAIQRGSPEEQTLLRKLVHNYPHTDAAIDALERITGTRHK